MVILTESPMVPVPPPPLHPAHSRILYLFISKLAAIVFSLHTKADDNLKFAQETSSSWVRDVE